MTAVPTGAPSIGFRRPLPTVSTTAAAVVVVAMVAAALVPALLAHTDPNATDFTAVLQSPSRQHLFGTDQLGRDVYARVVYGTRVSLMIGIGSTVMALIIGTVFGLTAAFGWRGVDVALMRLSDIGLAFPSILLALLVLAVLGPGPVNALVAIAVGSAPGYARLIRAEAQRVRTAPYVRSAFGFGLGPAWVLTTHVLPNAFGPALVLATVSSGTNVIIAAGLSFLGFGAAPPDPEWGQILAEGRSVLARAWWLSVFPGVAITAVVIAVTVLGVAIERRAAGR